MRLIDANAEKAKVDVLINSLIFGDEDAEMLEFMNTLRQLLHTAFDEASTVDAEPVRHGRWIPIDESETACSECGKHCCFDQNIDGNVDDYIFCPHCGAKMDLPEETEDKPTNDFIDKWFNTVY